MDERRSCGDSIPKARSIAFLAVLTNARVAITAIGDGCKLIGRYILPRFAHHPYDGISAREATLLHKIIRYCKLPITYP